MKTALFTALFLICLWPAMAQRRVVQTDDAPTPKGPYSQGIVVGGTLYVAGQVGMKPGNRLLLPGGIVDQTRQALTNIQAIVEAAGFAMKDVSKVTVYMTDLGGFEQMNRVFADFFGEEPPVRETVQVAALPGGAAIEISIIAAH